MAALLAACQATVFTGLNAVARDSGVQATHDIVFEPSHHLALDVYRPRNAHDLPVVVFVYGGRWEEGKRQWYRWAGEALAEHGLVAVVPDYRKYPQVKLDGFMHDAARAVGWTYRHAADYGGDPQRLFLMGHSSGAHLIALLATDAHWLKSVGMRPSQLDGVVGLAGPYDFLPLRTKDLLGMFGATHAQQERSQPVHFVDGDEPPMLLLQGGADDTVIPRNCHSLARSLKRAGEPGLCRIYPGVGHAGILLSLARPFRGHSPAFTDSLDFIRCRAQGEHDCTAPATFASARTTN